MAVRAPGPFPIFFQAQLGFDHWIAEVVEPRIRLITALGRSGPERMVAIHRLLRLAVVVALLGVVAGARVHLTPIAPVTAGAGHPAQNNPFGSGGGQVLAAGSQVPLDDVVPAMPPVPVAQPAPPAAPAPPVERTIPARRGALPVGKGMWIWLAEKAEGGNPETIVKRAKDVGLTHLYVRTGSLKEGFYAADFLNRLLPVAHAASIRVYAWDFPYLHNVDNDVNRALAAIRHVTPDGHRVDGYSADIELKSMGVNVTPATAGHFCKALRDAVGPDYPMIATVPRPSPQIAGYPFAQVVSCFDAIAPMVYWLNRDPANDIAGAIRDLAQFGKPIIPAGQAYDSSPEGGPPGVPPRPQLIRFMQTGDTLGASGVSWWSWQHASQEAWDAVRDAAEFRLPVGDPAAYTAGQVRAYQTLLTSLGFPTPIDGAWGPATDAAVRSYQEAARLLITGIIDQATQDILLTPFAPPLKE
ncbi:MAG TPA: peptidoglycan-binding domain-containing protein [Acidimicrobiales bacterium]|nr:peptidoglycan-binding domain-containing protein [Acidimicrobiales bacterium]